jgi:hypothetical protein
MINVHQTSTINIKQHPESEEKKPLLLLPIAKSGPDVKSRPLAQRSKRVSCQLSTMQNHISSRVARAADFSISLAVRKTKNSEAHPISDPLDIPIVPNHDPLQRKK